MAEGAAFFAFDGRFDMPTASGGSSDTAKCAFPEEEEEDDEEVVVVVKEEETPLEDCARDVPLHTVFHGAAHALMHGLNALGARVLIDAAAGGGTVGVYTHALQSGRTGRKDAG